MSSLPSSWPSYYEMTSRDDVVVTVATDSMEMYQSRLHEMTEDRGSFTDRDAVGHLPSLPARCIHRARA